MVTLDFDESDGRLAVAGEEFYLVMELSESDVSELRQLGDRSWLQRESLRAGTCLGHSVFWSTDGDAVSLLVGTDDESWTLSVTLTRPILVAALTLN
ncbi:MAG: hypothetical protein U0R68_14770 [Candidatus Nanopelagicales bacterium]